MKIPAAIAAALVASLAVTAPPAIALAQNPPAAQPSKAARDEATSRFNKGLDLFKEGDYRAALIELRRAYELVPTYKVLYNIGQVQFQLQDYAGALGTLERYLSEGGRQVPAARRTEVEKDIQKLKTRISHVEITINVQDAEIAVDDEPAGKGPFTKPIVVSAGRHRITASREGYVSQSKVVDVASNDTAKLNFELTERGSAQPAPPPEGTKPATPAAVQGSTPQPKASTGAPDTGAPKPPPDSSSAAPIGGWIATGALAAGAVVFGVLALGASSDLKDLRKQPGVTAGELSDASSKTTTFAVVSDVCTAAAIIAGGISLYVTISGPSSSGEAAAPAPAVRVGVAPSGVRLAGTF